MLAIKFGRFLPLIAQRSRFRSKRFSRTAFDLFAQSSGELLRRLNEYEPQTLGALDDLVETIWGKLVDFDQRQKEQFLILLIDRVLF